MVEFVAASGAKIKINVAPWADAKMLKKAIQKEVDFNTSDINQKWFIEQIFKIDGSDVFEAALWACLRHCSYTPKGSPDAEVLRIDQSMMDNANMRQDYAEIVSACVKENLGPLVESLLSKFAELEKKQAEKSDQK
jgi:hypothetical protein